jgi:hypothetical protein
MCGPLNVRVCEYREPVQFQRWASTGKELFAPGHARMFLLTWIPCVTHQMALIPTEKRNVAASNT